MSRLRASSSSRRRGLGRRLRPDRRGSRLLVLGRADRTVADQLLVPPPIRLGLPRRRRGGDRLLPRRFLGEPVIGLVEHREHVALAHGLADIDLARHDLAADAKRLVHLVTRLHRAGVAVRFVGLVVADLRGANRPQRLDCGLVRLARGQQSPRRSARREGLQTEMVSRRFLGSVYAFHEYEQVSGRPAGSCQ